MNTRPALPGANLLSNRDETFSNNSNNHPVDLRGGSENRSHFVGVRAPVSRQGSRGYDGKSKGAGSPDPIRGGPGGYRKTA